MDLSPEFELRHLKMLFINDSLKKKNKIKDNLKTRTSLYISHSLDELIQHIYPHTKLQNTQKYSHQSYSIKLGHPIISVCHHQNSIRERPPKHKTNIFQPHVFHSNANSMAKCKYSGLLLTSFSASLMW